MSINRQFSLPNCVFILEGLNSATDTASTARPELSILTRFECYFAREKQALVGGLDLLQSLVAATNDCVQACISGVPSATAYKRTSTAPQVEIKSVDHGFELTVPEDLLSLGLSDLSKDPEISPEISTVKLRLSAVQLFDLMEAIDQLAADQQTLPNLDTAIRPRSRAQTRSGSLIVEKSAPVAIGTASVAAAAAALFFVPVPKVTTPKPQPSSSPLIQPSAVPPAAAPPLDQPKPSTSQPSNVPQP
jgi:Domain of unknown function (DUF4335)